MRYPDASLALPIEKAPEIFRKPESKINKPKTIFTTCMSSL